MACNISSAVAREPVSRSLATLPVYGMIDGAVQKAAAGDRPRVGLLATEGTVRSGAYEREIRRANTDAHFAQVACPRFVPLVESGAVDSEEAEAAAREYLQPLAEANCDRIILGCTHYPFLIPTLERVSQ